MLSQIRTSALISNPIKKHPVLNDRHDSAKPTPLKQEWFSEKNIRITSEKLEEAYVRMRRGFVDQNIDAASEEGQQILHQGLSKIDCSVPVPRPDMKMNRVVWFKKQLRQLRYQASHAQSVSAGELGEKEPFISDKLHTLIQNRRSAPGRGYSSEQARSAKNTVHAWAIKKVADAAGLHGIALTVTDLGGDDAFQANWRRFQHRLGRMHGFVKREAQGKGRPHWHLVLYVENERFSRLLKAATEIFGTGYASHLQVIEPSSSRLIRYLLKELVISDGEETEKERLARRASSFHAISGRKGIQFLDCASSKEWDRLRTIKPGSSALCHLNETEIELRNAAIKNDYYMFIVLSACRILSADPDCSLLIKKIAALAPCGLLTTTSEKEAIVATGPAQVSKGNRTVAHRSKKKGLEPRIQESSKQNSRQGGANPTSKVAESSSEPINEFEKGRTVAYGSDTRNVKPRALLRTKRSRLKRRIETWGRVVEDVAKFAKECESDKKVTFSRTKNAIETEANLAKTHSVLEKAQEVLTRVSDDLAKLAGEFKAARQVAPPSIANGAEIRVPAQRKTSAQGKARQKLGRAGDGSATPIRVRKSRSTCANANDTEKRVPMPGARPTFAGQLEAAQKVMGGPSAATVNYSVCWKVVGSVGDKRQKLIISNLPETSSSTSKACQVCSSERTDLRKRSEGQANAGFNDKSENGLEFVTTRSSGYVATGGPVLLRQTLRSADRTIVRFAQMLLVNACALLFGFLAEIFRAVPCVLNVSSVNKKHDFWHTYDLHSTVRTDNNHFLRMPVTTSSLTTRPRLGTLARAMQVK